MYPSTNSQVIATGPEGYYDVPQAVIALASTIPLSSSANSAVILNAGFSAMTLALTLSQAGTVSVQRYVDSGATQVQGAAYTGALVATTPFVLNIPSDGTAWEAVKVTITNSSGSTAATLSVLRLILHNPYEGAGGGSSDPTFVNLTQVGGTNISAGTSTPAASLPITQAITSSFFRDAGALTTSAVQLPSHAMSIGAFLQNTGSVTIFVGSSNAVTADTGLSTSGYEVVANGQLPLFGNNTNLSWIIGASAGSWALVGA